MNNKPDPNQLADRHAKEAARLLARRFGFIRSDREGVVSIAALISVASIDTGDPKRDARLCAQDFFDVEHHPEISYRGVSSPGPGDALAVRGVMSMCGVSRPLELRAEPSQR